MSAREEVRCPNCGMIALESTSDGWWKCPNCRTGICPSEHMSTRMVMLDFGKMGNQNIIKVGESYIDISKGRSGELKPNID
jgi:ribosomal protein L37AE/L43A